MALTQITSEGIKPGEVKSTNIDADAVTQAHIEDNNVYNRHLIDDVVGTAEIADNAVTNAQIADNAVGLAQMASGTDGQIITYDASGDPVAVGPGTDGQVLTSTGAGSPPAFEAIPAQTPEGTAILSTGESGGTKFLREDGDGTSSWQSVPTAGAALTGSTNNTITTVTGANAIQGEANLQFDGTNLGVGTAPTGLSSYHTIHIKGPSGEGAAIRLQDNGDTADSSDAAIYKNASALYLRVNGTDPIKTYQNGAERVIFASSGDVQLETGDVILATNGAGIQFHPHAGGNKLDDYEEGTWTPGLSFGGGTTGMTYSSQTGFYTKIGRLVQCGGTVILSDMGSSTGAAKLTGLPFTIGDNDATTSSEGGGFITYWLNFGQNRPYHILRGIHNSTTCDWMYGRDGGYTYSDSGAHSDFTDSASFRFVLTFQT